MSSIKVLYILIILMFYSLLFIEQRTESREKALEILKLTQQYEELNSRKQELVFLIEKERERLVQGSRSIGNSLSPNDIVYIR